MVNENWKKDPRLKAMNPEKLKLLEQFADRLSHTEKDQLLKAFFDINQEARQKGISFTDKDTSLITSILTSQMNAEDKKKLSLLKMLSKKIAGRR